MPPRPISLHNRVKVLQRIAAGLDMDLTERVIGTLILLYAQPPSAGSSALPSTFSPKQKGAFSFDSGDPPAPIPSPPFDDIVRTHLRSRHNLFPPGRRACQPPLHPTSIRLRLTALGIPNMPGRSRALREMLLQAPPAVVASMLGFHVGKGGRPSPPKPVRH